MAPGVPSAGAVQWNMRDASNVPNVPPGKLVLSASALPPERTERAVERIGGAPVLCASASATAWPSQPPAVAWSSSSAPQGAVNPPSWEGLPAGSAFSTVRTGGRTPRPIRNAADLSRAVGASDATGPGGRGNTAAASTPTDAVVMGRNGDAGRGAVPCERAVGKENDESGSRAEHAVPRPEALYPRPGGGMPETGVIVGREFARPGGDVLPGGSRSSCRGAMATPPARLPAIEATFSQRGGAGGEGRSWHGEVDNRTDGGGQGADEGGAGEGDVLGAVGDDTVAAGGVPAAGGQAKGGDAGVAEDGEGKAGAEGAGGKEACEGERHDEGTPSAAGRGIQQPSSACSPLSFPLHGVCVCVCDCVFVRVCMLVCVCVCVWGGVFARVCVATGMRAAVVCGLGQVRITLAEYLAASFYIALPYCVISCPCAL